MVPKWSQNYPEIVPKWSKNGPKMVLKWSQNGSKMVPKWSQKRSQNSSKMGQNSHLGITIIECRHTNQITTIDSETESQTSDSNNVTPADKAETIEAKTTISKQWKN